MMCGCQDFPRIWFCKHIAAIHFHFPHLCFEQSDPIMPLEYSLVLGEQEGDPNSDFNSNPDSKSKCGSASAPEATLPVEILTLTHEIISLSQILTTKKIDQSHYLAVIETLRSAKYSLTVADTSAQGTSALPDTEFIPPNQNSWSKTAVCMGIKWPPKQKCLPKEHGLMKWAIGVTSRCHCTHNDPYDTGEHSGTQAKPDTLSYPPPCNCAHLERIFVT
jgi:hypothetical protein